MRHGRRGLAAVMILLLCAAPAGAGWQVIVAGDGILSELVYDLAVGPDDSLWFLTNGGVSRYDGLTWTNYTRDADLAGMYLFNGAILADRSGNVWVASHWSADTSDIRPALMKFNGVRWEWIENGPVEEANQMIEDRDGNIWFATEQGAVRFDGITWTEYGEEDGLVNKHVRCLYQDRQGALWFGTPSGLSRFQDGVWTTITTEDGLGANTVKAILEDRQGNLWIGTYPISRFDGETWTTYGTAEVPPWGIVSDAYSQTTAPGHFAEDREGNLWLTVNGAGVVRHRDGVWKVYRDSDDPRMSTLEGIAVDGMGTLWLATRFGAVRFDGEDWDFLYPGITTAVNTVEDILEERPGLWWMATAKGLYRYEDRAYTVYTADDGMLTTHAKDLELGPDGSLWVGGSYGISIFDGQDWTTMEISGGVTDIYRHSSGEMFVATPNSGFRRLVGSEWITYDMAGGLPSNKIYSICEDDSAHVWVAAYGYGVGRFDGATWRWYTTKDGLAASYVYQVVHSPTGQIWAATNSGGIARLDGERWTSFRVADGLCNDRILCILADHRGVVWAGSQEGGTVSRFDGEVWKTFTSMDGLLGANSTAIMEDHAGRVWIGSEWGVTIIEEDLVAPKAFFHPSPPRVSSARRQMLPLTASYGETKGVAYTQSLDGGAWSAWSRENTWLLEDLSDGVHEFSVRARDAWGNASPHPARTTIEIDATPPEPVILSPEVGAVVRGRVILRGTADDPRFQRFRVLVRPAGAASWSEEHADLLFDSEYAVTAGSLALWKSEDYPDGAYDLRVEEADTLGLLGTDVVRVVVDNVFPWVEETSPAVVSAALGGEVFSTHGDLRLYFPPHAFGADATVILSAAAEDAVPDSLPGGGMAVHPGFEITWPGAALRKPAVLDLSIAGTGTIGDSASLAVHVDAGGAGWRRLGGTVDAAHGTISASITEEGHYAVFRDAGTPVVGPALSGMALLPRVFSPQGDQAVREVAIRFSLGASGPVTVTVFNRAGRRTRSIVDGLTMNAGINVLRWEGRDEGGDAVPDGLYLVVVEAAGEKLSQTLAVVR